MTTHRRLLSVFVAVGSLTLVRPVAAAEPAAETTTTAAPLTVALELTFAGLSNDEQAELTTLVRTELDTGAAALGLQPSADGQADLIMRTDISRPDGQTSVYLISTTIEFEGEIIREVREDVCLRCTAAEVAAESLTALPDAAGQAHEARANAAPPELPPPVVASLDEPVACPTRRPLGPLGYVGIASMGLGLGAAIAGAVLLHRGRVVTSPPGALELETVDHRPAGVALTGAGLGVVVIGNVLFALDLSVLRHRKHGRVELSQVGMMTEAGGFVLSGRF